MVKIIDLNLVKSLDNLENSKITNRKLIEAALYIIGYETLKGSIVDNVKELFMVTDDDKDGYTDYKSEVLIPSKHGIFSASVEWLKKNEAIDDVDCKNIELLREHRDEIAHKLPELIFYHNRIINLNLLQIARSLIVKIDSWWMKNYSNLPENTKVFSGPFMILEIILSNASSLNHS